VKDIMIWRNFGWKAFQVGTCEGGLDKPGTGSPSGYCGNTDSNYFCSKLQISTKTGSLKFSNKKNGENGLVKT
jgi:hypothetical protein